MTDQPSEPATTAEGASANGELSPTALERTARAEAARQSAPDSKLTDVSSLRVGGDARAVPAQRILQRVVMPRVDDPLEVRPLYLDEPTTLTGRHTEIRSRRAVSIPPSVQLSFATYFNAFPASYWKRWTRVEEVALHLVVQGAGRIDLYRSKPNGDIVHLQGKQFDTGEDPVDVELRVSLAPFEDGGWVWFDATTHHGSMTVGDAAWTVDTALPEHRLAVAITTFNRPGDCIQALAALSEDSTVLDRVATVWVVDQGTVKVREHDDFAAVHTALGDRLKVIDQPNLGGSGGFARGMLESVQRSDAEHVLVMDDDVRIEPDSVLRLAAFAGAAATPAIVGAQMLNLQAPSHLHAMGEIVDFTTCFWRPAPGSIFDHDFTQLTLRQQRMLHARIHSTYNGWWMCLIPRKAIERVGLPLPFFIKWDDAEYSLRAAEAGFPTVSLPGSAIWHMPWTDKDDATDWTAYFHLRNRLITMALHSPHDVRRALVQEGLRTTFKHLMKMEYSTVALHHKALEDFLAGPARLFESLRTALPMVRDLRSGYDDARLQPSAQEFPPPSFDPARAEKLFDPPVHPAVIAARAVSSITHNLRAPDPEAHARPQVNVPARNGRWFLLGALDSATVSNADGTGVAFRRRDPRQFRTLMWRTLELHRKLVENWSSISRSYRAALPELSSVGRWRSFFDES